MALKSGTWGGGSASWSSEARPWGDSTHLINVAEVNDGKVLDALGDLEESLVLAHAVLRWARGVSHPCEDVRGDLSRG